jgi:hypothetical protein
LAKYDRLAVQNPEHDTAAFTRPFDFQPHPFRVSDSVVPDFKLDAVTGCVWHEALLIESIIAMIVPGVDTVERCQNA